MSFHLPCLPAIIMALNLHSPGSLSAAEQPAAAGQLQALLNGSHFWRPRWLRHSRVEVRHQRQPSEEQPGRAAAAPGWATRLQQAAAAGRAMRC